MYIVIDTDKDMIKIVRDIEDMIARIVKNS